MESYQPVSVKYAIEASELDTKADKMEIKLIGIRHA
jgi:hypothetical protein